MQVWPSSMHNNRQSLNSITFSTTFPTPPPPPGLEIFKEIILYPLATVHGVFNTLWPIEEDLGNPLQIDPGVFEPREEIYPLTSCIPAGETISGEFPKKFPKDARHARVYWLPARAYNHFIKSFLFLTLTLATTPPLAHSTNSLILVSLRRNWKKTRDNSLWTISDWCLTSQQVL